MKKSGKVRKLHNEDFDHFHSAPYSVRVIKARRMSWKDI
jgi:hypothetical protein